MNQMQSATSQKHHDTCTSFFFLISMWWRIFYGFLRLILGTTLLHLIGRPLSGPIYALMAHELTGKKSDVVLEHFYTLFASHNFTITYFMAIYFLFWGTVDIIISLCLLKRIKRAFPIAMAIIVLFICYGIFRYTHTHSLVLLCVIGIDIVILYFINREYSLLKRTSP